MLRFISLFLALILSVQTYAAIMDTSHSSASEEETSQSLLDNRFRVDPTISKITFVIYRSEKSKPVVLVRPDGTKYYAWRSPKNVSWYKEKTMDIITIDHPMPGPWQAVGAVTPKNHIKLISNLKLTAQKLPLRLYQGEELKFTAQLTSDGKPLTLRDFLDRVKLKVTLTKYNDNPDADPGIEAPAIDLGEFSDDGRGLDEHPGDGIFTVKLTVSAEPGKYRMRITSGNGVFLRAQEQEVLVYPTPFTVTFIQSRVDNEPHHIQVTGEPSMIEPGSMMVHINHRNEYDDLYQVEGQAAKEGYTVNLAIPYNGKVGSYKWDGRVFATELSTERGLQFEIPQHTYTVAEDIDYEKARKMQEEAEAAAKKAREEQAIAEFKAAQKKKFIIYVIVGNVLAIILGLLTWFILRKLKARREMAAKIQLTMPKE